MRARGAFASSWSDGTRLFDSETASGVRHAVWDAPETIPELAREAADPTLSPDGRWLVFAAGERGLNADLWIAERVDGTLREPEPLVTLVTGADELAPAFGDGALYFASDRAGGIGGLDLWRAPYSDGVFGAPERLGPGLNTPADETDPAPLPGARGLVFASDRALGSGFDLYRAAADDGGFYAPEPLAALNTPAHEREPALAHDQRSLYFASDREGGTGSFDLYRAVRAGDGWARPAPLPSLNTAGAERGPWVASDGFALWFDAQADDGERGLRRARSLELFLLPPPTIRTSEWILLAGLVALAVLAALAKRWRALDVQYKCLLVSLVAHILAMLYLNTVSPRNAFSSGGTGTGAADEATIQLTLRPRRGAGGGAGGPGGSGSGSGRLAGGPSGPTRAEVGSAASLGGAPAPGSAQLAAAEVAASADSTEVAPARGALGRSESAGIGAAPTLAEREAPLERLAAAAPDLALAPARGGGARRSASTLSAGSGGAPGRKRSGGTPALGDAQPGEARLATGGGAADALGGGGPAPSALVRGPSEGAASAELAGPEESFAPAGGTAPGLALAAAPSGGPSGRGAASGRGDGSGGGAGGSPERRGFASGVPALAPAGPERAGGAGLASALGVASGVGAESAPPRASLTPGDAGAGTGADTGAGDGAVAMRGPAEELAPQGGTGSAGFDATAGLASAGTNGAGAGDGLGGRPGGGGAGGPTRSATGGGTAAIGGGAPAAPGTGTGLALAAASGEAGLAQGGPGRGRLERDGEASGGSGAGGGGNELAMRAPADAGGTSGGGGARAEFDATAGLAAAGTGAPGRNVESGGERASAGPSRAGAGGLAAGPGTGNAAAPARAAGLGAGLAADAGLGTEAGTASGDGAPAGPARERLALGAGPGDGAGGAPDGEGVALRALAEATAGNDEGTGGRGGAEARPFDAIAGLGTTGRSPTARPGAAPERAQLGTRSHGPARPALGPLALAAAPLAPSEPDVVAPRPQLAETPYQNRFGAQKLRALEEFGGSAETEQAVAAGLRYLAGIQGEGGEWGQRSDAHEKYLDVRIGKSALALLAFLGAGHVPGGGTEHAGVVERTVAYLLGAQDPETGHFGRSCSYGHGIATYALAECFALTQEERLRAPLERAVAEILRHQSDTDDPRFLGGWGYFFADGHVWNGDEWPRTSVTAWQVMALESARLGGLTVPDQAFEDARTFLVNTWDGRARAFRYDHDPERLNSGYPILPASTPAALFALALLDVDPASAELAPARRFVLTRAPDGYRYTGDDDFVRHARGNLYFWYYATLAMFRVGGNEWERWNVALQETLLPSQDADGSWRPLDVYSEYAGDEDDERTYSTAMCVLSLEVYYRYFTPLLKVR